MIGLCQMCFSSNVEIVLDKGMTKCNKCGDK